MTSTGEASTSMSEHDEPRAAVSSVASWLGVLFISILVIIAVGGFVRLTGSGLSIPDWPWINGSLLPPFSEAGWIEVREEYYADQARLAASKAAGELHAGSLGQFVPREDLGAFITIFMVEWTHRLVAIIGGIIALGCMVAGLRTPAVRRHVGGSLVAIVVIFALQGILGGILVFTGTATKVLVIHLGIATVTLGLVAWTILRLLRGPQPIRLQDEERRRRRPLRWVVMTAIAVSYIQLLLGALVAGSRGEMNFSTTWPKMAGDWVPQLWYPQESLIWNLFSNFTLHQWVHRWFAWFVVVAIVAIGVVHRWRASRPHGRYDLALRSAYTFLAVQIALGLANVFYEVPIMIALAHLLTAMFLLMALLLAYFDLRGDREAIVVGEPVSADGEQAARPSARLCQGSN